LALRGSIWRIVVIPEGNYFVNLKEDNAFEKYESRLNNIKSYDRKTEVLFKG